MVLCRAVGTVIYLMDVISDVSKNKTARLCMRFAKKNSMRRFQVNEVNFNESFQVF